VNIEFDDAKSRRNARERGLPFDRAAEFEWETAIRIISFRKANTREVKAYEQETADR